MARGARVGYARKMARQLRELSIESSFTKIHHFSRPQFATKRSTLDEFVKYCEGVSDFQDGENPQTIKRALAAVDAVKDGHSLEDAIADAWRSFPLVKR